MNLLLNAHSIQRRSLLGLLGLSPFSTSAWGQEAYPNRAVKMVIPFPPGGNTDLIGRLLAQALGERFTQSFYIENKPGAGGNIGVDSVAKAKPDGYTLAYSTLSTHALNVGLYSKLAFDPVKDLEPVALTVQVPLILVVPSSSGITQLSQLIELLKKNPGKHNYASAGNGTSSHIACHLFAQRAELEVQHIPYAGTGPAMTDLLAGRVDFAMDAPSVLKALIVSGRLTPLAIALPARINSLPDVPTFEEAGLKNFKAYSWNALWAPAHTPESILDTLNTAVNRILSLPSIATKIEDSGVVPFRALSRLDVKNFMQTEFDYWVPIVKTIGVRLD